MFITLFKKLNPIITLYSKDKNGRVVNIYKLEKCHNHLINLKKNYLYFVQNFLNNQQLIMLFS